MQDPPKATAGAPTWAIHRRLYDWILGFSRRPRASLALAAVAFIEAFIPFVPPDVLLAPMCLGNRRRSGFFAAVAIAASVAGACAGYALGAMVTPLGEWIAGADRIAALVAEFDARGDVYVFIAALTPVPFVLLTIASGVAKLNLATFLVACVVGRSLRYGLVAGLTWWLGPRAMPLIDRWFNWICAAVAVIVIAVWMVAGSW